MAKTVGIIGGMGPLATVDLMQKIILNTPVERDQDHIHVIADNFPQVPDRVAAILGDGPNPTPYLAASAKRLAEAGAELLVIACNTAHWFLPGVESTVSTPFLNMPEEVAAHIQGKGLKKVCLLATTAAIRTELYQTPLRRLGIEVTTPPEEWQDVVLKGIHAVKVGDLALGKALLESVLDAMLNDAEAVIAACTEIATVLSTEQNPRLIDPTEILAKSIVREALADVGIRKEVVHG